MTETITDARRLAEEYTTVWNEREYDRIPALVSESVTLEDPLLPDEGAHGHEGLEEWMRQTVSQFPDFQGETLDLLAGDETVMALVEYSMTPKADVEDGSPTSPSIAFEGMVRLRFEDGKLQEHRGFYDPQKLYEQLDENDQ